MFAKSGDQPANLNLNSQLLMCWQNLELRTLSHRETHRIRGDLHIDTNHACLCRADSIPVMTGDRSVLPFDNEGKLGALWEKCIVVVPEGNARAIPEILAAIGALEYGQRLTACRTLYTDLQTDSLEGIQKQGLCTIIARVALQLMQEGGFASAGTALVGAKRDAALAKVGKSLGKAWGDAWATCIPLVV